MKRKFHPMSWILFLSSMVIVGYLIYMSLSAFLEIHAANESLKRASNTAAMVQQQLVYSEAAIQSAHSNNNTFTSDNPPASSAPAMIGQSTHTSVFSQNEEDAFSDTTHSGAIGAENVPPNGYIVGIDPGHQGYHVDMSDTEPLGPGSSEMKAKATSGTEGSYTGLPEYQLNLDVSLKLRTILESRGYTVVMTRTDNDTAISNKERAEYVAEQGADIFVRIHANGDDSHTASGALTMVPSPENPYVSYLSSDSVLLGQCILDAYCEATGFNNLGVQYYDNMSGINWSSVPVTILEMGFMTHEYDDNQMSDPDFQTIMAEGIANGIDFYFE